MKAYCGIYGLDEESKLKYLEEIFADVYARIRRGRSVDTGAVGETMAVFGQELDDASRNAETAEATRETRGSPEGRYSIAKMLKTDWIDQLKHHRHSDTLVAAETVDSFLANTVSEKPLAVPVSVITKAQSGKDNDHSITDINIQNLPDGMKNSLLVIDNPSRNSFVYITNLQDHGGLVTVAFLKDQVFDGDQVHKATTIHVRHDLKAMLQGLGSDATVYVRQNELGNTPGSSLQLGTLKARVEFIDNNIQKTGQDVKHFSSEQQTARINQDYLRAVQVGDLKIAQRMVDEAAKRAGYVIHAYHGTTAEFNVFEGGAFFTDDEFNADGYASGERVIDAYLKLDNPLVIDASGAKWDELDTPYGSSTREIAANLSVEYDGVIFQNIADSWMDDADAGESTVYFIRDSSQAKAADPVTYDEDGNIIPLSERFNESNPDIRNSASEEGEVEGLSLPGAEDEIDKEQLPVDSEGTGGRIATSPSAPRNDAGERRIATSPEVSRNDAGEGRIATSPSAPRNDAGEGRIATSPSAPRNDTGEGRIATSPEVSRNDTGEGRIATSPSAPRNDTGERRISPYGSFHNHNMKQPVERNLWSGKHNEFKENLEIYQIILAIIYKLW